MNQIIVEHPLDGAAKTYLTTETAADASSSTVENSNDFSTNDLVRFGELGEERAEIVTITSVADSTTLGHTTGPSFLQRVDTPLYEMNYDQIEVYSATSKDGDYALLATVSLNVDEDYTLYQDSAGDNDTWYKTRYKNSVTSDTSGYSPASQATGYPEASLGYMMEMVSEELGDPYFNQFSRSVIKKWINAGQTVMAKAIVQLHGHHLINYTTQALTTGTSEYDLPTNFMGFRKVTVSLDGGTTYTARFKREDAIGPNDTFVRQDPILFLRGTQFHLEPQDSIATGGTVNMWYHKAPTRMKDDDDEHGLPYGAHVPIVSYATYRAQQQKGELERANAYLQIYQDERTSYLESISESGQDTSAKEIRVTDPDLYDIADYEAFRN